MIAKRMFARASTLTVALLAAATCGAIAPEWVAEGAGQWADLGEGALRQGAPDGVASLVRGVPHTGGAWRALVEPALRAESAGIQFGSTPDRWSYRLLLGGTPGVGGLRLIDEAGAVVWQDKYAPWTYYTPYVLEGIVEKGRVRVEMFAWDGKTLVAQSDWIDAPKAKTDDPGVAGFCTENGVARFYRWESADAALSPIVPDSPSKLRLITDDHSEWRVVGDGDWKWTTAEHKVLRQGAKTPRSTAINTALGGTEGTWRCRVQVDPETGGSGMTVLCSEDLKQGLLIWLGGTYGAGGLMLYRLPLGNLWSSPQDKWHYNTEYVLEAVVADGTITARMLEADGTTVIAESPPTALTDEEKGRVGYVGFQTWKGTASFWGFSEGTQGDVEPAAAGEEVAASALGSAWSEQGGAWAWASDAKEIVTASAGEGEALALNTEVRGSRSVFRCRVTPGDGTTALALLFQVSEDLGQGFECRFEKGVSLRAMDGRVLWDEPAFVWESGTPYVIEGVVITDRVAVRILDGDGTLIAGSEDRYVSDTNNAREGAMGFRVTNGSAKFGPWSVEPSE
ncbi:MAG: hypothetical protein GY851_33415 [bacterium]|nr:hypothetical protein [bacterium]